MNPKTGTGEFFVVTEHSVFVVSVKTLVSSPIITKVNIRVDHKEGDTPVGSRVSGGPHVAITARGLFRYDAEPKEDLPYGVLLKRLEESGGRDSNLAISAPVGLFLKHDDAVECFRIAKLMPAWCPAAPVADKTREVLLAIGLEHPLITISTEGEFAVPAQFRPESVS